MTESRRRRPSPSSPEWHPSRLTDPASAAPDDLESPRDPSALEEEAQGEGAFNPETGEINWDCPCLGGMAHGPCGEDFKAAFSCFVYSNDEPKGMDCIEQFKWAPFLDDDGFNVMSGPSAKLTSRADKCKIAFGDIPSCTSPRTRVRLTDRESTKSNPIAPRRKPLSPPSRVGRDRQQSFPMMRKAKGRTRTRSSPMTHQGKLLLLPHRLRPSRRQLLLIVMYHANARRTYNRSTIRRSPAPWTGKGSKCQARPSQLRGRSDPEMIVRVLCPRRHMMPIDVDLLEKSAPLAPGSIRWVG